MATHVTDVDVHAAEDADEIQEDISVDLIDDGLYLGNLACARDSKTLTRLGVTHILTVDLVPLPRSVLDRTRVITKYVHMADVPKEDLIRHLPECSTFIKDSIAEGGTVLVHCYFGVSRSAAIVIAYVMEKYGLCYEDGLLLVKSKRRFIGPNIGFVAQLKLYGHMGYKIDKEDPRYKQFRLKMAGQKFKQVKILPQQFAELVKEDPGLPRERPSPRVYRCRACRRVLAAQHNIIPHLPKQVRVELAKKGIRPPPCKLSGLQCAEDGQILIQKLKSLALQILDEDSGQNPSTSDERDSDELDGYSEQNPVDGHVTGAETVGGCRRMWFVEPLAWMQGVGSRADGKLHCPKCRTKVGSFNWLMGCKCPCGQKVAPAFYLVPSKVELSNIVQNVQVTI